MAANPPKATAASRKLRREIQALYKEWTAAEYEVGRAAGRSSGGIMRELRADAAKLKKKIDALWKRIEKLEGNPPRKRNPLTGREAAKLGRLSQAAQRAAGTAFASGDSYRGHKKQGESLGLDRAVLETRRRRRNPLTEGETHAVLYTKREHDRKRDAEKRGSPTFARHNGASTALQRVAKKYGARSMGGGRWSNPGPFDDQFFFPPGEDVDAIGARELELFITNDAALYRQQHTPIIKNLRNKMAAGSYSKVKAEKLFLYLVDEGAKKYNVEYGDGKRSLKLFKPPTRKHVARELREAFDREAELGNYDDLLHKKYQKKVKRPRKPRVSATLKRGGIKVEWLPTNQAWVVLWKKQIIKGPAPADEIQAYLDFQLEGGENPPTTRAKRRGNPIRLLAGDKRAIEAFTDREPDAGGKLLTTDGRSLDKMGMGGGVIAKWHRGKIHVDPSRPHVKSDETILRALRKATPAKWFAKAPKSKAKRKRKKNPGPLAIVLGNPKAKKQERLERLWNKFHGTESRGGTGPTFRKVKAAGAGTLHLMEVGGAKELKVKGYAQLALRGYKAYATDDGRKLILAKSLTHVAADYDRLGPAQFVTYSGPAYSDSKRGVWWKHKFGAGVNVYKTEVGNVYVIYGGNFRVSDWLRD